MAMVRRDISTGEWICRTLLDLFDLGTYLSVLMNYSDVPGNPMNYYRTLQWITAQGFQSTQSPTQWKDREKICNGILITAAIVSLTMSRRRKTSTILLFLHSAFGHARDIWSDVNGSN